MFQILLQPQRPQPAQLTNFISQSLFPSEHPDLSNSIAPLPALGSLGSPPHHSIPTNIPRFMGRSLWPCKAYRSSSVYSLPTMRLHSHRFRDTGFHLWISAASFLVMICSKVAAMRNIYCLRSVAWGDEKINRGTALCCWSSALITCIEIVWVHISICVLIFVHFSVSMDAVFKKRTNMDVCSCNCLLACIAAIKTEVSFLPFFQTNSSPNQLHMMSMSWDRRSFLCSSGFSLNPAETCVRAALKQHVSSFQNRSRTANRDVLCCGVGQWHKLVNVM